MSSNRERQDSRSSRQRSSLLSLKHTRFISRFEVDQNLSTLSLLRSSLFARDHQRQRFSLRSSDQMTTARESIIEFEFFFESFPNHISSSTSQLYEKSRFSHIQMRTYLRVVLRASQTNHLRISFSTSSRVQNASETLSRRSLSSSLSSDKRSLAIRFTTFRWITLWNRAEFSTISQSRDSMSLSTQLVNESESMFLLFECLVCIHTTTLITSNWSFACSCARDISSHELTICHSLSVNVVARLVTWFEIAASLKIAMLNVTIVYM